MIITSFFQVVYPLKNPSTACLTYKNNVKSEYINPDLDALLLQASQQFESTNVENNSKSYKENNCLTKKQ